jgi:tetratricopeptide (TPR) repeat protein
VCADEAIDQWDVLEHLGSLVDKSVVLAEGDDLPRYRMLDTTRLFALERLADAGETTLILGRHAATMAELLGARAQWRTRWMSSAAQFRADASEIDNARAALEWTSRGTDDLLAIQVAAHTAIAFVRADMGNEYLQRALPVRSRVGAQTPLPLVALLWLNLARCGTKSSTADTLEAACHAVALYRRLGELPMLYEAIACAILIGANRAGAPPLQPWVEELRAVEQADWPPALLSFGRWALYRAMRRAGQDEQALQLACEQVQLSAQRDPIFTLRIEGVNVVDCEIALGRLEAAEQRARGVIGRLRAEGVGEGLLGPVHELLALTLILQGRHDEALPWARQAQPPLAADGDDLRLLEPLAWLVASQGRPEEAAMIAGHVETAHRRAGLQRWPAAQARWQELGEKLLERLGREGLAVQQRLGMSIGREAAYRMALAASAATAPD